MIASVMNDAPDPIDATLNSWQIEQEIKGYVLPNTDFPERGRDMARASGREVVLRHLGKADNLRELAAHSRDHARAMSGDSSQIARSLGRYEYEEVTVEGKHRHWVPVREWFSTFAFSILTNAGLPVAGLLIMEIAGVSFGLFDKIAIADGNVLRWALAGGTIFFVLLLKGIVPGVDERWRKTALRLIAAAAALSFLSLAVSIAICAGQIGAIDDLLFEGSRTVFSSVGILGFFLLDVTACAGASLAVESWSAKARKRSAIVSAAMLKRFEVREEGYARHQALLNEAGDTERRGDIIDSRVRAAEATAVAIFDRLYAEFMALDRSYAAQGHHRAITEFLSPPPTPRLVSNR